MDSISGTREDLLSPSEKPGVRTSTNQHTSGWRHFRKTRALVLSFLLLLPMACQRTTPPNFVFFMTDDQRWDSMSIAGNPILSTPNMDRIGREGAFFQNMFVTTSLCAPSRATILTGQWAHTHGYRKNSPEQRLKEDALLFPELMQRSGYETAFIGKSHFEPYERMRRFDYFYGFRGQGSYFDPVMAENDTEGSVVEGYVDDIIGNKAVEFIRRSHEKPFIVFVWFKAPHHNWEPPPRHSAAFKGQRLPRPPTFGAEGTDKPSAFHNATQRFGDHPQWTNLDELGGRYYATLLAVDDNVGKVLDALDEQGQTDNTVVVYTSDNGFFLGEWNFVDKRFMYEPSIRVPLLVRFPSRVPSGLRPDEMALNVDLAPTILELAGIPVSDLMQGQSLVPLLENQDVEWRQDWLYEYYEKLRLVNVAPHRGVRSRRYKYIHYYEDPEEFELYDLEMDPNETTNLIGDPGYSNTRVALANRLRELRRELQDPDLN